jgi:membrane fusion protein, multidrug efflux system
MKLNKLFSMFTSFTLVCMLIAGCKNETKESLYSKEPVNIEVQQVKKYQSDQEIAYSGTIEESESTSCNFSSMGTVSKVLVNEGQSVRKGQLLADLNSDTYKNTLEISLAMEKRAEDAYKRLEPMYKNGTLPEMKFVEVESGLQQTKAATAIARKNLNDCNLYSPVDGLVGKRSIDPGSSAMPGLGGITIVSIDPVYAKVSIPESEIGNLSKGQKAGIQILALGNTQFSGTINEIGVMADPMSHSYKIKIIIPNKDKKIKPGMVCNVSIASKNDFAGFCIPSQAVLVNEKGNTYVFTVDPSNTRAVRKLIKTGKLLKYGVEIIEGLKEGEQIVVTGQHKLVDNSPVNIISK